MSLFSKLFDTNKTKKKSLFLAGWEVIFNGDEKCENFLVTQAVDEKTAKTIWSSIELVFENGMLSKAYNYEEGEKSERPLEKDEIGLSFREVKENTLYCFIESEDGVHQLGGNLPNDFTMPEANTKVPFQYLGFFSNEDQAFDWLPFKLHLTCPIFLNFNKIFLDYTNPYSPIIINQKEFEKLDCSYQELNSESKIVFKPVPFDTVISNEFDFGLGHTGVPSWIQYPDIPRCPKTNKIMKFLCQLKSDAGVEVLESNIVPSSDFMKSYFKQMNFWGDGDLYIFFEPTALTACYMIQNT